MFNFIRKLFWFKEKCKLASIPTSNFNNAFYIKYQIFRLFEDSYQTSSYQKITDATEHVFHTSNIKFISLLTHQFVLQRKMNSVNLFKASVL